MMTTDTVTYLGQPLVRDALRLFLGDDCQVLPLPTDEAGAEFLRGHKLVLVPLSDKDRTIKSSAALIRAAGIECSISPVSAEWFAAVMPEPATLRSLLAGERRKSSDQAPRLVEEQTACRWLADYKRVEFPMVLEGMLPAGIVGGINAEGGTGKTYILISLFAAISTGISWGPFRPTRPHKVLLLLAEDPADIVKNRIYDICREIIPESHHELLALNFHATSIRGIAGPLMELKDGNPHPSEWKDWLDETILAHPGTEVLGLDPLRKFFGLDENRNEYAHAFIGMLEGMCLTHDLTTLYAHHVAKATRGAEVSQITGRGAGGLSDNCRWMAAMKTVDATLGAMLELEGNHSDYVEFIVTKSNYAPRLPAPFYFRRGKEGVLSPVDVADNQLNEQVDYLCQLVAASAPITQRQIQKELAGQEIRKAMKDRFKGWNRESLGKVVKRAVESGRMREEERQANSRGKTKVVLVVKRQEGEDED